MSKESVLIAKAAALKKSFDNIDYGRLGRCLGQIIEPLFPRYTTVINELRTTNPELFADIPDLPIPEPMGNSSAGKLYEKYTIDPLVENLNYVIELQAGFRIGEKIEDRERTKRVFISHGRSKEWYKVQAYLEKDLNIPTMELAQEPNIGRTVLQKLNDESDKCSVAIIVMTGDDIAAGDEVRARENVMHEIGYFQGKYGLKNVVLLHEEGVNIPSNIHGLVYIGFPKDTAEATFGGITRELKVLMA
jgi:hypothetical protein